MKTIIVTGASGFIGRHFISDLINKDIMVYAIVRNKLDAEKHLPVSENLNICEWKDNDVDSLFCKIPDNVDIMYHFAWIGFKPELRKDFNVQIKNIKLTLAYLEFAKIKKIKKIVMIGSTNEYLYCGTVINNDARPSPSDDYGAVKVALRYLGQQFCKENKIEFNYAVITGIYAEDRKDGNIISYTIDKLLKKEKPSVTKLQQLWDYIYIDDAIEALWLIGKYGKDSKLYAVGHGDNWELANYVHIIHEIIDPSLPLGIGDVPYDSDILPSSCMDLTELTNDTGFIPKVCFEQGIKRVIENWNVV